MYKNFSVDVLFKSHYCLVLIFMLSTKCLADFEIPAYINHGNSTLAGDYWGTPLRLCSAVTGNCAEFSATGAPVDVAVKACQFVDQWFKSQPGGSSSSRTFHKLDGPYFIDNYPHNPITYHQYIAVCKTTTPNSTTIYGNYGGIYANYSCPVGGVLKHYYNRPATCVVGYNPINNGAPKTCTGNPINLATGAKYQSEIDVRFSKLLKFFRVYNSNQQKKWSLLTDANLQVSTESFKVGDITQYYTFAYFISEEGEWVDFKSPYRSNWDGVGQLEFSTNFSSYTLKKIGESHYIVESKSKKYIFDLSGKLESLAISDGLQINLAYASNITTITDQLGNWLEVTYNATNPEQFTQLKSFDGRIWKYNWDASGRLTSVIYPDNTPATDTDNPTRQYLYEDTRADTASVSFSRLLTGIIDERGVPFATWKYDTQGRANYSGHGPEIDCGGGIKRRAEEGNIVYNADGSASVTTYTSCTKSRTAKYYFTDINGYRKLSHIDGDASASCVADTKSWTYDANGFEDIVKDKKENITDYDHNSLGQETQRIEAKGTTEERTITTTWHPTLRLPDTITEPLRTIGFTYDTDGKLLSRTETDTSSFNSGSRVLTYTYYPNNLLHTVDGARTDASDISTYTYNDKGTVTSITNALNQVTTVVPDPLTNRPVTLTDPNGTVTTLTYTPRGWLDTATVTTAGESHTTRYKYDEIGQLTRITRADGSYLDYGYNDARRLRTITNNAGEHITYDYDLAGNIVSEKITDGASTLRYQQTREFDELNRLLKIINANGQTVERFGYDKNNNPTLSERGGDAATQFISTYDALDRLKTVTQPGGGLTTYGYDAQGHITSVTDARNVITTYAYDGLGNLRSQTSPDTGTTSYQYDAAGNRTQQIDAKGVVTNYIYDALNRLTNINYPADSSKNIAYSYDATNNANRGIGHMTGMQDSSGSTSWNYDEFGRERLRQTTINGRTYSWSMTYDSANRLSTVRYPSGRKVRYVRNPVGQVTAVYTSAWPGASEKLIANNIAYVPFGVVNSLSYGNTISEQRSRNTNYQLTGIDVTGTATLLQKTYGYYPSGSIETISDGVNAAHNQTFIYDKLDRLTKATSTASSYGIEGYDYDAVGNRTRFERDADANNNAEYLETHTYDTSSNRLASSLINGVDKSYQHNANGQMTSDGQLGATLDYDITNRLVDMTLGTNTGHYTYNGLGQRVSKTRSTGSAIITTHFHYNADGNLLAETQADGKALREYMYLDGELLSVITPTTTSDTDNDGLNDAWEIQYFGTLNQTAQGDPDGDNINNYNEFINGSHPYDLSAIGIRGDISRDGIIDVRDVLWLQQYLSGTRTLNTAETIRADLYPATVGDGQLNTSDLLLLQKAVSQ